MGMNATKKKYRVGELRPSQVLFTYGIGSIVDLPYISTMVMGLDDWENPYPVMIGEERLLQAVRDILGPQIARLLAPPEAPEPVGGLPTPFDESMTVGVPVAAFPRWMVCPRCRTLARLDSSLFQLLKFRLTDRKKGSLTVQKLPDGVRLVCFFQTNENKGPLRHELYHIDAIASGRLCEFCSRWRCHDEPVRCAAV